jgi:mycofactocin biosynthesis protein MftB
MQLDEPWALVAVVRGLESADDIRSALVAAGIPEAGWPAYLAALEGLAESDMIRARRKVAA